MKLFARLAGLVTLAALSGCNNPWDSSASTASTASASSSSASSSSPTTTINRAPTIGGAPGTTATVGQPYSFKPTASDPNGDTLTFSISGTPSWATFDTTTGTLSGTPTASDVGTSSPIIISVSDGQLTTALAQFAIVVSAQVPTGTAKISWSPPTTNADGTPVTTLSGYRIHYGTSKTTLAQTAQISDPTTTTYTVTSLASGTWYFALTSVAADGMESSMSTIASKTIP